MFEQIAEIINQNKENDHDGHDTGKVFLDGLVSDLADLFESEYRNFERDVFTRDTERR